MRIFYDSLAVWTGILLFLLTGLARGQMSSDDNWTTFGLGLNGTVYALEIDDAGNLYAGGDFSKANGRKVHRVGRWDGSTWTNLGGGVDGNVFALEVVGQDIYVGGNFNNALDHNGEKVALTRNIARWNGTEWKSVGLGTLNADDEIHALEFDGTTLYMGGEFAVPGVIELQTIQNLASWNGLKWNSPGQIEGRVLTLAATPFGMAIGGEFTSTSGGNGTAHVVLHFGDKLLPLGLGVDGTVRGLAFQNGSIYVAGAFDELLNADGTKIRKGPTSMGIARWDGSEWHTLDDFIRSKVNTLCAGEDGNVYLGGEFRGIEDAALAGELIVPSSGVVAWTESGWKALGNGQSGEVHAITSSAGAVWIGGDFNTAHDIDRGITERADVAVNNIARWGNERWHALGYGVNDDVEAFAHDPANDDAVYIGGWFKLANSGTSSKQVNRLARWNKSGQDWSALGGGVALRDQPEGRTVVYGLAAENQKVYAAGNFDLALNTSDDSVLVNHVALWDENTEEWSALGQGLDNIAYAVTLAEEGLYVGGVFQNGVQANAESIELHGVGLWSAGAWQALGEGVDGSVFALAVNGPDVYVGGTFSRAYNADGLVESPGIARWDGMEWHSVGQGLGEGQSKFNFEPFVNAILFNKGELYVGGDFLNAYNSDGGMVEVNHLAMWNGTAWTDLAGGIYTDGFNAEPIVEALEWNGEKLYVAGAFDRAGQSVRTKGVATFDGDIWHALGSGYNSQSSSLPIVKALFVDENKLYLGSNGLVRDVGGFPMSYLAQWKLESSDITGIARGTETASGKNSIINMSPNPVNQHSVIHFQISRGGQIKLALFNIRGQLLQTLMKREMLQPGEYEISLEELRTPGPGVYFVGLSVDGSMDASLPALILE